MSVKTLLTVTIILAKLGLLDMKDLERPFSSQVLTPSKESLKLVTAFRFNRNSETDALASTEFVLDSEPIIQKTTSHWTVWSVCGEDIRLSCSISSLGNRTVSWVRYRDIHLLTAGKDSYTDDKRFSAHHPIMTNTWQLRIKNVTHSDAGSYECQVSTTPPIGHKIQLSVVEPAVSILGGPDLFINAGSFINLTCVANFLPGLPLDVDWFHEKQKVSFSGPRGGVSSIVEKGPQTVSQLLVQSARVADSGSYMCQPTYPANRHRGSMEQLKAYITIHILEGEFPAAIQAAPISCQISSLALLLSSALAFVGGGADIR